MNRAAEIRSLLKMTPRQVVDKAGPRLVVCDDLDALHRRFAEDVAEQIRRHNERGEPARLIVPVGPTGQYPYLADIVNRQGLSLAGVWWFFMDEYCDEEGRAVPTEHPLSFKGEARRSFFDRLEPPLRPAAGRVIFPDEANIGRLGRMIEEIGGIDTCYGGVGIHGHVAFNEPEPGVAGVGPRRVGLNDFTVTINAVRSHVGGNLEGFPRQAFSLGMKEILASRKIRLYCRNGCEFDWANTVLRLGLFGEPGDDYPVTLLRGLDYVLITDRDTLRSPPIVL
jgi:glucosamine-6-phosphate deaminase